MGQPKLQVLNVEYSAKCPNCDQFIIAPTTSQTCCGGYDLIYGYFDDDGNEYSNYEYGQYLAEKEFKTLDIDKQHQYNPEDDL